MFNSFGTIVVEDNFYEGIFIFYVARWNDVVFFPNFFCEDRKSHKK
jgi:hypothetical protein